MLYSVRKSVNKGYIEVIIKYSNSRVEQYCNNEKAMYKYLKNSNVVKKLQILMTDLEMFPHIIDFARVPKLLKYKLHDLTNDKQGIKSLRIDYTYRMELVVEFYDEQIEGEDVITIVEVSKHYEK